MSDITTNTIPINPDSFKISAFPWAIHRIRDGKIKIDQWEKDFSEFEKLALQMLEERKLPVDYDFLLEFREKLAEQMNWSIEYSKGWLRIDMILGREKKQGDSTGGSIAVAEDEDENEAIQTENVGDNVFEAFATVMGN